MTKGAREQGQGVGRMSRRTATWLAWSLWAACVVLIALALLLDFVTKTRVFPLRARRKTGPRLRCTNGGAVAGVPGGWRPDRLAPSHQPHRLDLLRRGTTLRDAALHHGVRRLRAARDFRLALGEFAAWFLTWVGSWPDPGRRVPDAAVPQWPATVSSVADRGMDGGLREPR